MVIFLFDTQICSSLVFLGCLQCLLQPLLYLGDLKFKVKLLVEEFHNFEREKNLGDLFAPVFGDCKQNIEIHFAQDYRKAPLAFVLLNRDLLFTFAWVKTWLLKRRSLETLLLQSYFFVDNFFVDLKHFFVTQMAVDLDEFNVT